MNQASTHQFIDVQEVKAIWIRFLKISIVFVKRAWVLKLIVCLRIKTQGDRDIIIKFENENIFESKIFVLLSKYVLPLKKDFLYLSELYSLIERLKNPSCNERRGKGIIRNNESEILVTRIAKVPPRLRFLINS